MNSLADHYRRWFAYEQDAHEKTLRSLENAPADAKSTDDFRRCLTLMGHIVAARMTWLARLESSVLAPRELFPHGVSLVDLMSQTDEMHAAWSAFLSGLNDADLDRVYQYRRNDGQSYSNTVEDTLTHLYGHSLYHRGQIAMLLRRLGAEPAATDFIFWVREKAETAAG
jgi:uncharacterized damage-inducible protein DinB